MALSGKYLYLLLLLITSPVCHCQLMITGIGDITIRIGYSTDRNDFIELYAYDHVNYPSVYTLHRTTTKYPANKSLMFQFPSTSIIPRNKYVILCDCDKSSFETFKGSPVENFHNSSTINMFDGVIIHLHRDGSEVDR